MNGGLPTPVVLCMVGITVLGGLAGWMLTRWVSRRGALRRLRELHAREQATTAVEMPFVLFVLIVVTLCIWQLGRVAAAYQVMDLAAFHAVRSASVVIPEDRTEWAQTVPVREWYRDARQRTYDWFTSDEGTWVGSGAAWRLSIVEQLKAELTDGDDNTDAHFETGQDPIPGLGMNRPVHDHEIDTHIGIKHVKWLIRRDIFPDPDLDPVSDALAREKLKLLQDLWEERLCSRLGREATGGSRDWSREIRGYLATSYCEEPQGERPNVLESSSSGALPNDLPSSLAALEAETISRTKIVDIHQAAVWACVPISGHYDHRDPLKARLEALLAQGSTALVDLVRQQLTGAVSSGQVVLEDTLPQVSGDGADPDNEPEMPPLDPINLAIETAVETVMTLVVNQVVVPIQTELANLAGQVVDTPGWPRRYFYSRRFTSVDIRAGTRSPRPPPAPPNNPAGCPPYNPPAPEWAGGDHIWCEVTHRLNLRVLYASHLFSLPRGGRDPAIGYWMPITATARMLNEGYNEKKPPGALDGYGPRLVPAPQFEPTPHIGHQWQDKRCP